MESKLEILQMLENGSITAEEAERLLDAVGRETLDGFRQEMQEMREQMAAMQGALADARCAAADARCAAKDSRCAADEAEAHAVDSRCAADEAEEHAANAEAFAYAAEDGESDDDRNSHKNAGQWEAFSCAMRDAEEAMGMVQSILESLGVQGVNVREKFREGMKRAQDATGKSTSDRRDRNRGTDTRYPYRCIRELHAD